MSDYTLNVLKMKSKKYEDYVNCINPDYNRDEELAYEVITRFNEYEKENQELKKQLEELDKKLFFTKNELDIREKSINNHLNQQKEFIKWLEDYLNLFDYNDIQEQAFYDMLEEILQKYKEIIGNDINVGSKGGKE